MVATWVLAFGSKIVELVIPVFHIFYHSSLHRRDYQRPEPIAIVGSGCRFPGAAKSPAALRQLQESPRDILMEIPNERFDVRGWYHRDGDHYGTSNVLHSYTLEENLTKFEANFFGISAGEAECIDPQQRLLLETV